MEERTLLFKLLSLKSEIDPSAPVKNKAFSDWLDKHEISLELPLTEALINVSSHFEAKTQTLWIYPHLFFEGVIQVLSGKRSYKLEAGFWDQEFPGEDSVTWQRFARGFLKVFGEVYDPEEVKRVLLLLRSWSETRKPMTVSFGEFMRFTKTCSLAPVRPSLPPKTRHLSTTKLQYAKLLFFTLESSIKRSYLHTLISRLPPTLHIPSGKISVTVKDYRKFQEAKSLRNPAHVLELTEKLESLREMTERRHTKPSFSSKLEAVRGKVMIKSIDFLWKRIGILSMQSGFERIKEVVGERRERVRRGLKKWGGVIKRNQGRGLQRRFHLWHVETISGGIRGRSRSVNILSSLNASHISKDTFEPVNASSLNVSSWFLCSYLFNSLEKVYFRRLSTCFQPLKSIHLNKLTRLSRLLTSYRQRILLKSMIKWSSTAKQLHCLSRYRVKCGENMQQMQGCLRMLVKSSSLEKLISICKRIDLKKVVRRWNRWRKRGGRKTASSPVTKRKEAEGYHTPSKKRKKERSPSPQKSPSSQSPSKSPRRHSDSSSNSPKPRKSKASLHAPKKKRDRSPTRSTSPIDSLKWSIIRIRLQHACEKVTVIKRMLNKNRPQMTIKSAFGRWNVATRLRESPRFVDGFPEVSSVTHIHNLSFSGDEGLFEDPKANQTAKGVSIAELRAAIATLRKAANVK